MPSRRTGRAVAHHFLTAWTLTAVIYLAALAGATHDIDARFLIFMQRLLSLRADGSNVTPTSPVLVVISDAEYAQYFSSTSPMDRAVLATALSVLIDKRPSTLVVDIDLSPDAATVRGRGQSLLDDKLDYALDHGVQLVLTTPVAATNAWTMSWMRTRCQHGVIFAFPDLKKVNGRVINFPNSYPSIGVVAKAFMGTRPDAASRARHATSASRSAGRIPSTGEVLAGAQQGSICESIRRDDAAQVDIAMLARLTWADAMHESLIPIDYSRIFDSMRFTEALAGAAPIDLTGRVVFFGASRDAPLTPNGELPGAQIHASVALTEVRNGSHLQSYLIEILIGTVVGLTVAGMWQRLHGALERWRDRKRNPKAVFGLSSHLIAFAAWGAGIVTVCVLALVLIVRLSMSLWSAGTWLNPATLVVGMLIDGILSARNHAHVDSHSEKMQPVNVARLSRRQARKARRYAGHPVPLQRVRLNPVVLAQLVLIGTSVVILAIHH